MSRSKLHDAPFAGPRWWVAGLWLLVATIAQGTIVHYINLRGVEPSIVLVTVVWYAIRVDARRAAAYGLAAGLLLDVLSAQSGGAWTISTTLVAILAGTLSRGFFADSLPLVSATTVVATLVDMLIFWSVRGLEGYPPGLAAMHARDAFVQALFNMLVMLAAMLTVRRFDTRFE